MAKPLKTSPPISFRIPIHLWDDLQERSEAQNQTVGAYVAAMLVRFLEKGPK